MHDGRLPVASLRLQVCSPLLVALSSFRPSPSFPSCSGSTWVLQLGQCFLCRTSLGPRGMDKMIQEPKGTQVIG